MRSDYDHARTVRSGATAQDLHRRGLLLSLGMTVPAVYAAPTLLGLAEAEAGNRRRRRNRSRSRSRRG
jgi:hypothetical protein